LLLQALDKDARAYVEYAGKMLDATAFVKATAADEFALFGFREEEVLCEVRCFKFENVFGTGGEQFGCLGGLQESLLRECAELQA
jgi:hypothetical protein